MSDSVIIALLAAGCFVLWMLFRGRKPSAVKISNHDQPDVGWFAPTSEDALQEGYIQGVAGADGRLNHERPSPASTVSRKYTFIATAVLSPAWHNEQGWPAVAVEHFPFAGQISTESIRLTAIVRSLYEGPDLPDKEISETVPNPPEVLLRSLHASGQERIKAVFEIADGVARRARNDLPDKYNATPKSISVDIRMEFTGKPA